jgi:uncharacterized membrane protein
MTPRAVWIALFASLAFNVFALGAFVGVRLAEAHAPIREGEPAASARGRNPLAEAVRALPPEAQTAWRAQNRTFMESAGPEIRESRRLTREALRGLGAEPFDPTAATAALQRARDAERNRWPATRRTATAATLGQAAAASLWRTGSEKLARVPWPGALVRSSWPPCISTSDLESANPSPVPCVVLAC